MHMYTQIYKHSIWNTGMKKHPPGMTPTIQKETLLLYKANTRSCTDENKEQEGVGVWRDA